MATKRDILTEEQTVMHDWTKNQCIDHLKNFIKEKTQSGELGPYRYLTRNFYRKETGVSDSTWTKYFGTFSEFRRQSRFELNRNQHGLEREIAKHASVEHYKKLNERHNWGEEYIIDNKSRFKTILFVSDLHDIEIDPFFLRVMLDTLKRAQPDVFSMVGDIFDFYEFSRFVKDPRDFKPVERIKFVHDEILAPAREAAPNTQFDLVEGNHEARLLKSLADSTPALRVILSDLHGMSVSDLMGLKKFEVNYISRADLGAFTKSDLKKEVAKHNYKIYYDTVMAYHYPALDYGLPGVNGHFHEHRTWQFFNPLLGVYEWVQMGCGHRRLASYCEGAKWGNGFCLVHVDTVTKATNFEYIPITDFAVVGGKWYHRTKEESIE